MYRYHFEMNGVRSYGLNDKVEIILNRLSFLQSCHLLWSPADSDGGASFQFVREERKPIECLNSLDLTNAKTPSSIDLDCSCL